MAKTLAFSLHETRSHWKLSLGEVSGKDGKQPPLAGVGGEECWEIKSLASTQTQSWECCYRGNHDIIPAPSPEWGRSQATDEETKVQTGSLSGSTRR